MKFGDKLLELRKKSGYSQEELAEKLGVSRQSVSKWESNTTYPETDKIVQIANLFDCSMDDLINDKVTDIESSLRKNKNNFNEVWDSLLEFITKTINMFSHMKFSTGLKCVIEMIIVALLLSLLGNIVCGVTSKIIANLFSFLDITTIDTIRNVLNSIFHVFWFILAIIILIHTFKIRYLNYYEEEIVEEKKVNNDKKVDNQKTNQEKIIIRDEKDKPFAFLSVLSKIVLFFIKFIVFWIAFSIIFVLISLVIASVISLAFIPTNVIFIGSTLSLIASTVIILLFLLLCIYFIISKEVNVKVFAITFVASLVVFGVGIGICVLSVKNFDIIEQNDDKNLNTEKLTIPNQDDLVVTSYDIDDYTYIIDDSIPADKIELEVAFDSKLKNLETNQYEEDKLNVYKIYGDFKANHKEMYKTIIKDLKNNQINVNHLNSGINSLTIKANSENINRIISNTEKLYLLEKEINGNTIKVIRHQDKVMILNGKYVEYDARTDELIYKEIAPKDYKCSRTVRKTTWGDMIRYECAGPDDYIDYEDYEEDYDE